MRNGTVIDGTGRPPVEHAAVVIEDHRIEAITTVRATAYDRADIIIEANGGFILPGILNHHAHGLTRGPLMITGGPPVSDLRARSNRLRLLKEGVTRAANVDGFPVVEEGRAASRFPGLTVLTTTVHTPQHIKWATEGPFVLGGVTPYHRSSVEEQLQLGAVAIGETGPGIDHHWLDFEIIPLGVARSGGKADATVAKALRLAAAANNFEEVERRLEDTGSSMRAKEFQELLIEARKWSGMARASCEEAITIAQKVDVPVILHHTPTTYELVLEAARMLGPRLVCAHSNFQVDEPGLALEHAKELQKYGARIDVMTGDVEGAQQILPTDEITHALMRSGCVDLISTDYAGGYWDSMLRVVERAVAVHAMTIEEAIRSITGRVAEAIPRLAPGRGTLAADTVADIVITEPGQISRVTDVLVSGIPISLQTGFPDI